MSQHPKTRQDGGPAFPPSHVQMSLSAPPPQGMSIRDYFAAAAMTGLLDVVSEEDWFGLKTAEEKAARLARSSFCLADAMIAERERTTSDPAIAGATDDTNGV